MRDAPPPFDTPIVTAPCILAVDDEPEILSLLSEILEHEGYRVVKASSISEFWRKNSETHVDLYLVDIGLPDGSGLNLVKDIRRISDRGIIILTGRGSETDQVVGLEIGADDYVTKPFRLRELAARVNSVYRRTGISSVPWTPPAAPTAIGAETLPPPVDIGFDGYKVSTAARQLWDPEGIEVILTTVEFDLLVALVNRRGHVLNRDQIMNALKGREWESYDRVVDGIVSRLRKKIPARNRASHYIRTIHGIGYSFTG